jgi:hypothetical protein
MSQPDLMTQLREARPVAPAEVREHVRRIAAEAAAPPRRPRVTWRRAFVIAVPVAAALAGAALLIPSGGNNQAVQRELAPLPYEKTAAPSTGSGAFAATAPAARQHQASAAGAADTAIPAPNPSHVQIYTASLQLRVPNTQAVSDNTKQAVRIARTLGGYPSRLEVDAAGRRGYASLVLRIPKQNVEKAVSRLAALGTIVGENVSIQDIQARVDSTSSKISRLRSRLAHWQSLPPSDETQKHIDQLTAQIAKLVRGRANTIHTASYATVSLELTTKQAPAAAHHSPGPLHSLEKIFRWAGIGAVYVLALGTPLLALAALGWLAARTVRRRREEDLLSRV